MRKQTVINKVEAVITDTTSQDIEIPLLLGEGIVRYDTLVGVDYDNQPTAIVFGFKVGAGEYLLHGDDTPVAGVPVSAWFPVSVPFNYKPFIRVIGGTSGDKVSLVVYGTWYEVNYPVSIVAIEE